MSKKKSVPIEMAIESIRIGIRMQTHTQQKKQLDFEACCVCVRESDIYTSKHCLWMHGWPKRWQRFT